METSSQNFEIQAITEAESSDGPSKVKKDGDDFTPIDLNHEPVEVQFAEDEFTIIYDNNENFKLLLWQAFAGPPPSFPKKGELIVYFPQGHLEYAASLSSLPPTDAPAPTFNLPPQIICRVVDFQLLVSKKNDEVYIKMSLLPVSTVAGEISEGKEFQGLVVDKKGDGPPANSRPFLSYKKITVSDKPVFVQNPSNNSTKGYTLSDRKRKSAQRQQITAKDVHGVKWKFWRVNHVKHGRSARAYFTVKWTDFVKKKNLAPGDTVVFFSGKKVLWLGIKRAIQTTSGVPDSIIGKHNEYPNVLSPVADAISNKSIFHVFYSPRINHSEFVIPYQKYVKRIRKPLISGEKFQMQYEMDDSSKRRCSGVVTGADDLDPYRWPNSPWRCLLVKWDKDIGRNHKERLSPWEIDFSLSDPSTAHSSPRLKRQRTSLPDTPANSETGQDFSESSTIFQTVPSHAPKSCVPLTLFHAEDKILPTNAPKNLVPHEDKILRIMPGVTPNYLAIDSFASLASLLRSNLTAGAVKHLKISKCPDLEVLLHQMAYTSFEYLEFNCCSFLSCLPENIFPTTLKRLKITDCINSELILKVLMDQKALPLLSLEIDGCSSLVSFPIDKLPTTLRQLKIVNCMNLKSLRGSLETKYCDSLVFGPVVDSCLENMTSTSSLELKEIEIWDCVELEFLPEDMKNFTFLDLLSISNCPSLESFPEGGLPNTSLKSLVISECENLESLPHQIHKVTSLQNLSVSSCPSLVSFPEGGLPPNLVSLRIIDCENLIPLSRWELHKLKHLSKYSIIGGRPDREE